MVVLFLKGYFLEADLDSDFAEFEQALSLEASTFLF